MQTVPCSTPGCKNTRITNKPRSTKYCVECRREVSLRNSFWQRHSSTIKEIKQMAAHGYGVEDIAKMLGRQKVFVQHCIDIPMQKENPPYKVVSADYWPTGILIDPIKLENEILKHGTFDPSAILSRGGKRYRVVRRRLAQKLEAI